MHEKESTAVLMVVVIAIGVLAYFMYVVVNRLGVLQTEVAMKNSSSVDVSGWASYRNSDYGFELEYPPNWELSTDGLSANVPFVAFGNPLDGAKTYAIQVFIEKNPTRLSSGAYVHSLLDAARMEDAANAKNGPAPQAAPRFEKIYVLTAGGYPAYELYGVFEFDHLAERIYVALGNKTLRFDFPVAKETPGLSLPVANNGIAHQIVDTLVFTR